MGIERLRTSSHVLKCHVLVSLGDGDRVVIVPLENGSLRDDRDGDGDS